MPKKKPERGRLAKEKPLSGSWLKSKKKIRIKSKGGNVPKKKGGRGGGANRQQRAAGKKSKFATDKV